MMNEKGFATIFGLCLILIIALIVKGIQESEMNHSYETDDFQVEFNLQNAADSGIYRAVEIVHANPNILPVYKNTSSSRKDAQYQFEPITIESSSGSIKVETWGERIILKGYKVNYKNNNKDEANWVKFDISDDAITDNKTHAWETGYAFFSVASIDSKRIGGKLYRRSFAYVLDKVIIETRGDVLKIRDDIISEKEKKVVHFMDIAADNLKYNDPK